MKKLIFLLGILSFALTGHSQKNMETAKITEYLILNADTVRFDGAQIDGEVIKRVSGVWTNGTGGAGSAAVDSLIWDFSDGYLGWYISGSVSDSISLDDRYVEISDTLSTGIFYTQRQVDSLVVNYQSTVFTISLPINGTLSGSVAAAVEGTDYPDGWVLAASGGDLQVNHGLGRYTMDATVKYNTTGDTYRQLRNFDNAYSGVLDVDDENVTIESISTFYTAYKLKIHISFE